MPTRDSYPAGVPSWIDLSTTDPAGAKSFYGSLFGWTFEDDPTGDGGVYTMCRRNGRDAAGLSEQSPEQAAMNIPPLWNSYVTVDDLSATVARVEPSGGQVMMPPMEVMTFGHMAVVVDPTGAVLCLWEPREHIGAGIVNEHGALIWNELMTTDPAEASAFYAEVLGWGNEVMDMSAVGGTGVYTLFTVGDAQIAGAMVPPVEGIPSHWGVYFGVDDAAATVAQVTASGGTVMMEPMDSPPGILAACQDPQGATFSIMQPSQPVS